MIGLDVDGPDHDGKHGDQTIMQYETKLEPLPPTWRSTSRTDGISAISFYRVPAGVKLRGVLGPDVEILQHHHRPPQVWPSIHEAGRRYRWIKPDGTDHVVTPTGAELPAPDDLPYLPDAWLAELTQPLGVDASNTADADGRWQTPHITALMAGGIPEGQAQDDTLMRVAWYLRGQRTSEAIAHAIWRAIVDNTRLTRPGEPCTDDDFRRHWKGADAKQRRDEELFGLLTTTPIPEANYFDKGGLLAVALARDVYRVGPLAMGIDDRIWRYSGGVWEPAPHVVRERCVQLLCDRFRRTHSANAEDVIKGLPGLPIITSEPISQWINVRNGLLDWRTGQLQKHTPDVLSTVQLAVAYDPAATCPHFDAWLAEVIPDDCLGLVWELLGYLLYSGNPLHVAIMLTGTGRNGKGTFLRVVQAILGKTNISAASLHDLVNTRFRTATLFGKIANIADDIDATYIENTAIFKAITGDDVIQAVHKGRDAFEFTPWAVPVFSANEIPPSADTTVGYLSRWVVVPFPRNLAGREDRNVEARLHSELPGIVTRAVRAQPALLDRGQFPLPAGAQRAREEFERRVDQVRTWLADCAEPDPGAWTPRTPIYQAYSEWAARDGHKRVKASTFDGRLTADGVEAATIKGTRGYRVRIVDPGRPPYPGLMPVA